MIDPERRAYVRGEVARNPAAAIEQGEQAYHEQRKKDINKNPYPPGHAWRVYWDRGWIAAKEREEKNNG